MKILVGEFSGQFQPLTSLTLGGRKRVQSQSRPHREFASQGAVRTYMAVPPQDAGQADFSLPAIAIGTEADFFVHDCSPKAFDEDVVVAAFSL